jgi:alkylhydroperoxidase/carboxymuconolactone decarboxylase family protein YurZ
MQLTDQQEKRKKVWIEARGYWKAWTEGLLQINPAFLDCYAQYGGYTARKGLLSPIMSELIYIALDASGTHLFDSGLRTHMQIALKRGATPSQIMEVLQIGVAQGLDGTNLGVRILVDELHRAGQIITELEAALTDKQMRLKAEYEGYFHDWPEHCEYLLRLDVGYFEVMLVLLKCSSPGEGLDPISRTLIALALNACFTELNPEGLRMQIRRALKLGVDKSVIVQILQMVAHIAIHACSVGVPALVDTMSDFGIPL